MAQNSDLDSKVLHAVEASKRPQDNTIELSTGVILRGKQSPPMILMRIMGAFPRPQPPLVFIEGMGREMENPDNPDYQDRVKAWTTEQSNAMIPALILTGTELVSFPEGMTGPDAEEWLDEYSLLNMPMHRDNPSWRYLTWVQYKAATSAEDIKAIMKVVGRLSGIPENAVKSAEQFPGSDQVRRE